MKRFIFCAILLLFSVPTVHAQENFARLTLRTDDILRGQFVQTRTMQGFDKPLISTGTFVISPREGLIWNVKTPFATTTIITPSGLVQNSNGMKTMSLSAQKMPFVAHLYDMIGGVLTGKWAALQEEFTIEQNDKSTPWHIGLVPLKSKEAFLPFREINVTGDQFVDEVVMVKPDGDTDVLSFTNVASSQGALSQDERTLFGSAAP